MKYTFNINVLYIYNQQCVTILQIDNTIIISSSKYIKNPKVFMESKKFTIQDTFYDSHKQLFMNILIMTDTHLNNEK